MHLLTTTISGSMLDTASFLVNRSLAIRTLAIGIPLISLTLSVLFYVTCNRIESVVTDAIARNGRMHAEAIAHEYERILTDARNELCVLAAGDTTKNELIRRILFRKSSGNNIKQYREIAFISNVTNERYVLLNINNEIIDVAPNIINNTAYSPFQTMESDHKAGAVRISEPLEVTYNMIQSGQKWHDITFQVIRLQTPIFDGQGTPLGILLISLDLKIFRDELSKKAPITPILEEDRSSPATVRSMFFDYYGWILFQAEDQEELKNRNLPLRTDDIRSGLKGDIGRKGFSGAFRPTSHYSLYQEIVESIKNGRSDYKMFPRTEGDWNRELSQAESISFAPVKFLVSNDQSLEVIGGIAILDTTFALSHAFSKIRNIFLLCFLLALLLLTICLGWVSRGTSLRLRTITNQLKERNENLSTDLLMHPQLPLELENLRSQINTVLSRLQQAKAEHANKLAESNARLLNQPFEELPDPQEFSNQFLVGDSPSIVKLKEQIVQIAKVTADVLVVGETGTGKELVSQAIHATSDRADKPFISINCGALDENLLMDTLFGHVKGAFTEALQNRKGAFIAAEGGTLLLDEIGNATPKVQQALLRALSIRKIRPLGSDQEIAFDARIIAATNADLRGDGKDGSFRNDLYYRLSVFSIQTPPLRDRKEDIPALVSYFMYLAEDSKNKGMPEKIAAISRGAMEKLLQHNWPGNVRELKNVITRAMAFCQTDMLQASDILLYEAPLESEEEDEEEIRIEKEQEGALPIHPDSLKINVLSMLKQLNTLNARQQKILPIIMEHGSITRQEYQEYSNENISMRTAQYDLQQLVSLGLIHREGRGPAMRYIVVGSEANSGKKDNAPSKQ